MLVVSICFEDGMCICVKCYEFSSVELFQGFKLWWEAAEFFGFIFDFIFHHKLLCKLGYILIMG